MGLYDQAEVLPKPISSVRAWFATPEILYRAALDAATAFDLTVVLLLSVHAFARG
jgi:hypothetical protein